MAYYCERGCEKASAGEMTYADGSTESLCRDCIDEHVSHAILTAVQMGVVQSSEGAEQLKHDTLERMTA